jgi:hypothetical protein
MVVTVPDSAGYTGQPCAVARQDADRDTGFSCSSACMQLVRGTASTLCSLQEMAGATEFTG